MKELSFEQIEGIEGGGWMEYVDLGCAGYGAALYFFPAMAFNPVGVAFAVGCIGWGLGRGVSAMGW